MGKWGRSISDAPDSPMHITGIYSRLLPEGQICDTLTYRRMATAWLVGQTLQACRTKAALGAQGGSGLADVPPVEHEPEMHARPVLRGNAGREGHLNL